MGERTDSRYLVLSDMHFGTPESSINSDPHRQALVDYMVQASPWDEIVLSGDILDLNLSTFTKSIEGAKKDDVETPLVGFRQWLTELHQAMGARRSGATLRDLAHAWIYLPGNHDYKVWDMLSTQIVCEDVLAAGLPMGTVPTPLYEYEWVGQTSFVAGLFAAFGAASQVVVKYPNHIIGIPHGRSCLVVTHGHYLDPTQTRGLDLHDEFHRAHSDVDVAQARRRIVIATAQYQALASVASFTKEWRRRVSSVFGPRGWVSKFYEIRALVGAWLMSTLFSGEGTKGKRISDRQLLNIEAYLESFSGYTSAPRWFLFGHTHRQDVARTPRLKVQAFNVGSFYVDRGMPITFLEVFAPATKDPDIHLMCVDEDGTVRKSSSG